MLDSFKEKGLVLDKDENVINVIYHDVEVLNDLIHLKKYKLLYLILDEHGYKSVVNDYVYDGRYKGHISEDYYTSVCYYERPLKIALDKRNIELALKLISCGAFDMSQEHDAFYYIKYELKDDDLLDKIMDKCELDKYRVSDLMKDSYIFSKFIEKKPDSLDGKFEFNLPNMNLLTYALSQDYIKSAEILISIGIPLTPVKLYGYKWKSKHYNHLIEGLEGYDDFVLINES